MRIWKWTTVSGMDAPQLLTAPGQRVNPSPLNYDAEFRPSQGNCNHSNPQSHARSIFFSCNFPLCDELTGRFFRRPISQTRAQTQQTPIHAASTNHRLSPLVRSVRLYDDNRQI